VLVVVLDGVAVLVALRETGAGGNEIGHRFKGVAQGGRYGLPRMQLQGFIRLQKLVNSVAAPQTAICGHALIGIEAVS